MLLFMSAGGPLVKMSRMEYACRWEPTSCPRMDKKVRWKTIN
jgi:hypothetical protein